MTSKLQTLLRQAPVLKALARGDLGGGAQLVQDALTQAWEHLSRRSAPQGATASDAQVAKVTGASQVQDALLERERRGLAVIDLGSSSAKMLILRKDDSGQLQVVLDVKIQTELGLNIDPNENLLPEEGKRRALEAIKSFLEQAEKEGIPAEEVNLMATAAVRNTKDGREFADRILADFHLESVRVLSGPQEAEMGYLGAIAAFASHVPERFASLDLGGSSFQLAIGTESAMEQGASTQVGSNIIQAELLPEGTISASDFDRADAALREEGGAHEAMLPLDAALLEGRKIVATGGVSKFLRRHFGCDVITREQIDAFRKELGAMEVAQRGPFLQQGKDPEVLAALGIDTEKGATGYGKKLPASITLLLRIMDGVGIDELHVSETDNRHALINKVREEIQQAA